MPSVLLLNFIVFYKNIRGINRNESVMAALAIVKTSNGVFGTVFLNILNFFKNKKIIYLDNFGILN